METSTTSMMCDTSTVSVPQLALTGSVFDLFTRGFDVLM